MSGGFQVHVGNLEIHSGTFPIVIQDPAVLIVFHVHHLGYSVYKKSLV
jgi:hypothetical protein